MVRINKGRIDLDKRGDIDLGKKRNPNDRNPRERNWRPPGFIPVEEPPEGLVPLGGGFEVTPNRPIDPRECNLYSNSPYCGGNPWTRTPIGFEWEILQDECAIGIRLVPIAGFTKMPDINIVWRNPDPECQPPPPDPPPGPGPGPGQIIGWPPGIDPGERITIFWTEDFTNFNWDNPQPIISGLTNVSCEPHPDIPGGQLYKFTHILQNYFPDEDYSVELQSDGSPKSFYWGSAGLNSMTIQFRSGIEPDGQIAPYEGRYTPLAYVADDDAGKIKAFFDDRIDIPPINNRTRNIRIQKIYKARSCVEIPPPPGGSPGPGGSSGPPPPPPPPMRCCPVPRQNDELIRLLIQKMDELSKAFGVKEWDSPATVPETMIVEDGNAAGNISLQNFSKFMEWAIVSLHDKLGEFEIKIEIDDQDPLEEGDQPKTTKLPTLAEAIGEMFVMNFDTAINSQVLMNMATRLLLEQTQIKNTAYTNYYMGKAIAAYLGFPTKDEEKELPLVIDPNAETLSRMMDETYKTVTESNLRSLGFKIRDKFGANSGYKWDKGKAMAAYHDWEKGYRFQLLVKTQTEAQRIVTDVMGLQGHEPEWIRLNFTENAAPESRYLTDPPVETIAGQSVKMPQLRPRVEVRFTHAEADIYGLIDPIVLYDRTNLQFNPLVDDTSDAP